MKQSKLIWAMFVKKMPKTKIEIETGHSKHPIAVAYLPLEQIWIHYRDEIHINCNLLL